VAAQGGSNITWGDDEDYKGSTDMDQLQLSYLT